MRTSERKASLYACSRHWPTPFTAAGRGHSRIHSPGGISSPVHNWSRISVFSGSMREDTRRVMGGGSGAIQHPSMGGGDYPVLNENIIVTHANGPNFNPCAQQPQFEWSVNFSPATGTAGYIVQRVESTYEARNCDGTPGKCDGTINHDFTPTLLYWEAWKSIGVGLEPDFQGGHDTWRRTYAVPSCGSWSIEGTLYRADAIPADFITPNPAVPDAVDVPATVIDPTSKVLGSRIGRRRIGGEWNCCDADPAKRYHRRKD